MTEPAPARAVVRALQLVAPTMVYGGNRIGLLINGEQYFPALISNPMRLPP
jgi:hypothetical protein